jgi:hypothetical protein
MVGVIFLTGLWAASVVLKQDVVFNEETKEVSGQMYYSNTSSDEIVLEYPLVEQIISSPLTVRGKARGFWFFEASAPVVLTDWDGRIITQGVIQAKGDWMTSEFVPFEGILIFETPSYGDIGALILQNDNPSGFSSNDKALEISIRYH